MKQHSILLLCAFAALGLTACAPQLPADASVPEDMSFQAEQTADFGDTAAQAEPFNETISERVTFTVDAPVLAPSADETAAAEPVPELPAETTVCAAETAPAEETETTVITETTEASAPVSRDFGSSIWLAKEFEGEAGHYYLFCGDGSGCSRDPETWTPLSFTYEMTGADSAMFHFGSDEDMSPAVVNWLSDTAVQLTWQSGTVLTLHYVQAYDPAFQPPKTE